jgi:hypothetical protein
MACDQCGGRLYGRSVIDHYELKREYTSKRADGRAEMIADSLDVQFCSAKCLCEYVAQHILPDALTE